MKNIFTLLFSFIALTSLALDPNQFTITRISAPYFIVDGNAPGTVTKAYVGFEIKNNSGSITYTGLRFAITSIGTSVAGQNYTLLSPASGLNNVGTLAPGESRVCYYYVSYPASVTPQATFNVQLSDNTAGTKTQSFTIRNRSAISANAGGTATQAFTNQDLIGGIIIDDVTYVVGNAQNGDETDFQVSVSAQYDPSKMALLRTQVIASSVPGIPVGSTDSLYFISGSASNGSSVTMRWIFRISGYNFTNYLLPCAGATSGNTNYKYALNTSLGSGTPVTVSAAANPLIITKSSDQNMYKTSATAVFTITMTNPGAYGVTIDKVTDELPAGFVFQSIDAASQVTAANSTSVPVTGATGTINFEGGVLSGENASYYIPSGGSIVIKYAAVAPSYSASNLLTTVRNYVSVTEVGSAQNTVGVSATLPVTLLYFKGNLANGVSRLDWATSRESNTEAFEIERSSNNNEYVRVGKVEAAGFASSTHTYSFAEPISPAGAAYYRLKITDRDGQFTYSPVVLLTRQQTGIVIRDVNPNPFTGSINISVLSGKDQPVSIFITDISGKTVLRTNNICRRGENVLVVDKLERLQAGIYFLRLFTADGSWQQKIVKTQ